MILLLARDCIRKNLSFPADPGCSGVPGFPYTHAEGKCAVIINYAIA